MRSNPYGKSWKTEKNTSTSRILENTPQKKIDRPQRKKEKNISPQPRTP